MDRFPVLRLSSGTEMHKRIVLAFGCGVASALMSSAGHSGSGIGVILANFAMLPLIIVGLAHGTRSTAVASLTGIIALIALPFGRGHMVLPCDQLGRGGSGLWAEPLIKSVAMVSHR